MELKERVGKFSESRERKILGFDIDACIKLKFPPKKLNSVLKLVPWGTEPCPFSDCVIKYSKTRTTYINRIIRPDMLRDVYFAGDTYDYDYLTGKVWMYTFSKGYMEWYSTAHRSLAPQ